MDKKTANIIALLLQLYNEYTRQDEKDDKTKEEIRALATIARLLAELDEVLR